MTTEVFIAKRLRLRHGDSQGTPSLTVALVGITLAVVIMLLSIAIVMGFKREITDKIFHLAPHLKVTNAILDASERHLTVNGRSVMSYIENAPAFAENVVSMSLVAEQPAILKTAEDFKGVLMRGVRQSYDLSFLRNALTEGRLPNISDTATVNTEVIISKTLASQLSLKCGDRIHAYFIDDHARVRRVTIVGIFDTNFETFDKSTIIGSLSLLQELNQWNIDTGNYVDIRLKDPTQAPDAAYALYATLAEASYNDNSQLTYNVTPVQESYRGFFSWLDMLDMNVIIILVLMVIVAGFTLIAAMLMIVLERVRIIGELKAFGATNAQIRNIFILLTGKLILKALIIGNIIGLGLALLQKYCHIVRLNPETYYMSFVPIHLSPVAIIALNLGIIVVAYLTLLLPGYVISSIKPAATIRFE